MSATTVTTSPRNQSQQQFQADVEALEDVNCSTHGGKVGPAGGTQVDLIAVASTAGRVGCSEAFTVIIEYYRDAPTKSEGADYALTVRGWHCIADTGAQGTGIIDCKKDSLSFHTRQSGRDDGAKNPVWTTGGSSTRP
ncbi:hypothetical protein [Kibdelosporangium aridum]|uniref:hypothetical protein n=1 Tax=Kibdelosporangium aridum TaxID=2030 RepID=UPI000F78FBDB|nr:hypothetical protein [Kibdelosporangium aridum]